MGVARLGVGPRTQNIWQFFLGRLKLQAEHDHPATFGSGNTWGTGLFWGPTVKQAGGGCLPFSLSAVGSCFCNAVQLAQVILPASKHHKAIYNPHPVKGGTSDNVIRIFWGLAPKSVRLHFLRQTCQNRSGPISKVPSTQPSYNFMNSPHPQCVQTPLRMRRMCPSSIISLHFATPPLPDPPCEASRKILEHVRQLSVGEGPDTFSSFLRGRGEGGGGRKSSYIFRRPPPSPFFGPYGGGDHRHELGLCTTRGFEPEGTKDHRVSFRGMKQTDPRGTQGIRILQFFGPIPSLPWNPSQRNGPVLGAETWRFQAEPAAGSLTS